MTEISAVSDALCLAELCGAGRVCRGNLPLPYPVDLRLYSGEFAVLLGPNGAGKTSLMRLLSGVDRAGFGQVKLYGTDLGGLPEHSRARLRSRVGVVSQHHHFNALLPVTVRDMVVSGRLGQVGRRGGLLRGDAPTAEDWDCADRAMRRLEIDDLAGVAVRDLSGGELRKAQIARSLAQQAALLLLDEPTAGLDLEWQCRIVQLVDGVFRDAGASMGILMSTHHTEHIPPCCSRVILFASGKVQVDGPPADVMTAENLSRLYHFPLTVERRDDGRYYTFPAGETGVMP